MVASNALSLNRSRKRVVNTRHGPDSCVCKILADSLLHSGHFRARVSFQKVQLTQVQQGNGVRTRRLQHNDGARSCRSFMITTFLTRKESGCVLIQAPVQLMVVLGSQGGPHDPRVSTNVYPQVLVAVGVTELSAVDHP